MSVDELEKLAKLKESGALTEEEFQAKKAEILGGSAEKPKKKSKVRTVLTVVVGLWIAYAVISAISKNSAALSQLPACDSSPAKETLTDAFDQSQFARSYNLSAIEVSGVKSLSDTKDAKTCSANITLNNTESVSVEYKMEMRDGGNYMLSFEVKE